MTNALIDALAFQINSETRYEIACAISPSLRQIEYSALYGHYFVLTGDELMHATVPPGALEENHLVPMVESMDVTIVRMVQH